MRYFLLWSFQWQSYGLIIALNIQQKQAHWMAWSCPYPINTPFWTRGMHFLLLAVCYFKFYSIMQNLPGVKSDAETFKESIWHNPLQNLLRNVYITIQSKVYVFAIFASSSKSFGYWCPSEIPTYFNNFHWPKTADRVLRWCQSMVSPLIRLQQTVTLTWWMES